MLLSARTLVVSVNYFLAVYIDCSVIIRYLDDLAHRLCFLQIEVAAPGKNYAPLLATLTNHMASLKGGPVESVEGRTALDVLRSLQASLAERHRELLEDTILLPDETGLKRLITVSNVAVAMRRELVRVLDQPMPEAALQVPTPKNESNLYSVRSDAIKLLHRIQHNLLPALRKELLHTPSEQRSMAIGQIVRSVKAVRILFFHFVTCHICAVGIFTRAGP